MELMLSVTNLTLAWVHVQTYVVVNVVLNKDFLFCLFVANI